MAYLVKKQAKKKNTAATREVSADAAVAAVSPELNSSRTWKEDHETLDTQFPGALRHSSKAPGSVTWSEAAAKH